ncbi:fimbrial protein [Klebsiella aerogenes]|nr:fimbrial protein [Klebsiella aerogenes]
MKFKKLILVGGALSLSLLNVSIASATNTITFTGSIDAVTCDVELHDSHDAVVGTGGSGDITLLAGHAKDLTAPQSSTDPEYFSIVAKNCDFGDTTKTKMYPRFTSDNSDNAGYLNNTATTGGATNVQLGIYDHTGALVKIGDTTAQAASTSGKVDIDTTEGAQMVMKYSVRYYSAAGGASEGAVTSTVNYDLTYE